jgi:hypothetical protein
MVKKVKELDKRPRKEIIAEINAIGKKRRALLDKGEENLTDKDWLEEKTMQGRIDDLLEVLTDRDDRNEFY